MTYFVNEVTGYVLSFGQMKMVVGNRELEKEEIVLYVIYIFNGTRPFPLLDMVMTFRVNTVLSPLSSL